MQRGGSHFEVSVFVFCPHVCNSNTFTHDFSVHVFSRGLHGEIFRQSVGILTRYMCVRLFTINFKIST